MRFHFVTYLFLAIALSWLSSCESYTTGIPQPSSETVEENSIYPNPEIRNGHLAFQDWNHAFWYRDIVRNLDPAERSILEQESGYTSMQSAYTDFEEWSFNSSETGYGVPFDVLKEEYLGTLVFDEEWDFKMDIWSPVYAEIVSKTGWIQVADTLYLMSREKQVQLPADADPSLLSRVRGLEQSIPSSGITIINRPIDTNAPRFRCRNYGGMPNTSLIYIQFANSWLFQDPSHRGGGGNHEWKLEVAYEGQRNPSNLQTVIYLDVKYRKRGLFGAWYATKPYNWSSDGTSSMESTHATPLTTSAVHTKASVNNACCSSWTHYVYSDRAGDNPDTNPPDINTPFQGWGEECFDFALAAEFQGRDGDWYPQFVSF